MRSSDTLNPQACNDSGVSDGGADPQSKSPDRTVWRGVTLAIRLKAMRKLFVSHRAIKRIVCFIELELQFREAEGKATGILVTGDSGAGKTRTIDHLARLYPDLHEPELTIRRLVRFKIPKSPSAKSMSKALLYALGDPLWDHGDTDDMFRRIQSLLVAAGTRVICIDDFQDIPSKRRRQGIKLLAEWVRDICEIEFAGVVVAFGTSLATVVRDSEPQLLRRMQPRLYLPAFSLTTQEDINAFGSFMKRINEGLPLAESSPILYDGQTLFRIERATAGNPDYVVKLLAKALAQAVRRGCERIEIEDLREGFIDQHQVLAEGGNPFDADYDGAPLTKPGQIFHREIGDAEHEATEQPPLSSAEARARRKGGTS